MKNNWIKRIIFGPYILFAYIRMKFLARKIMNNPDNHGYKEDSLSKAFRRYVNCALIYSNYKIKVINPERLKNLKKTVFISNHQTNWDPLVLGVKYEGIPGWFAKKELFENPYTSNLVWVTKSYRIERGDPIQTARQFLKISKDFKNGRNLSLFPEGTRSKSNKMQPFNPDIFKFIKSLKADIKPIKLDYSVNYVKDDGTLNYDFFSEGIRNRSLWFI